MNQASGTRRIEALDFTKGILVLFMILYHWINYFVRVDWDVFRYLRFITPSFILITGFLVSHVYLAKHPSADRHLRIRLVERGVKILALFTALNIFGSLLLRNGYSPTGARGSFTDNAFDIYVSGNGSADFNVLVPIGYFLLLSPFILWTSRVFRFSLPAAALASLALVMVARLAGVRSANLELTSIAVLGLGVGTLPIERINAVVRRLPALILAYGFYLVAITIWNIRFELQVVGVCLSLLMIYAVAVHCGSDGVVQRRVLELGRYSLFAYIVHIGILQGLRWGMRRIDLNTDALIIPLVLTIALTVLLVEAISLARAKSNAVDKLYRIVFA